MTIETLTQQVMELTAQTAALLTQVHAQAEYVRSAAFSAMNVTQSTILTTSKSITSIGAGQTAIISLSSAAAAFSNPLTVVYGYVALNPSNQPYIVEIYTRSAGLIDTVAYQSVPQAGTAKLTQPFTVIKNDDSDTVVMKVTNLGSQPISNWSITLTSADIQPAAVNVMKSPILTLAHDLSALSSGGLREISLVVPSFQFTTLGTVVFAIGITSTSAVPYSVEIFTRGLSMVEKPVYQTATLTGNLKDVMPFTILKNSVGDDVVMRVKNVSPTASLSGWSIKMFTVGI